MVLYLFDQFNISYILLIRPSVLLYDFMIFWKYFSVISKTLSNHYSHHSIFTFCSCPYFLHVIFLEHLDIFMLYFTWCFASKIKGFPSCVIAPYFFLLMIHSLECAYDWHTSLWYSGIGQSVLIIHSLRQSIYMYLLFGFLDL